MKFTLHGCHSNWNQMSSEFLGPARDGIPIQALHSETMIHCDTVVCLEKGSGDLEKGSGTNRAQHPSGHLAIGS